MLLEWLDVLPLVLLAPFIVLELVWRARRYAAAPGWRTRALAVSAAAFGVSLAIGRAWGAMLAFQEVA